MLHAGYTKMVERMLFSLLAHLSGLAWVLVESLKACNQGVGISRRNEQPGTRRIDDFCRPACAARNYRFACQHAFNNDAPERFRSDGRVKHDVDEVHQARNVIAESKEVEAILHPVLVGHAV